MSYRITPDGGRYLSMDHGNANAATYTTSYQWLW